MVIGEVHQLGFLFIFIFSWFGELTRFLDVEEFVFRFWGFFVGGEMKRGECDGDLVCKICDGENCCRLRVELEVGFRNLVGL